MWKTKKNEENESNLSFQVRLDNSLTSKVVIAFSTSLVTLISSSIYFGYQASQVQVQDTLKCPPQELINLSSR